MHRVLDAALAAGYRSIDTAAVYKNEADIGASLKELLPKHGLQRADIFLTSKLGPKDQGTEKCRVACLQSIDNLQCDYLDLYLIHWPGTQGIQPSDSRHSNLRLQSWHEMEMLQKEGKVKAIGVSNFLQGHLNDIINHSSTIPSVLQIEYHPHLVQRDLVEYCKQKGIHFQAYSSLGTSATENKIINVMADTNDSSSMFSLGEDESYSTHMSPSRKILNIFTKNILSFIRDIITNSEKESFCMADFGTADGGISLRLFNLIIDEINKHDYGKQVCVVYEDQPFNDFNKLFRRINGLISRSTDKINQGENVSVLASGTSMYKQCLPSSFLDFAFSSMATHWLSKRPCLIKDGIFQTSANEEEIKQIRQQSANDWKQFLLCRGKELRIGGCLFVISFITDDNGDINEYFGENSHKIFSSIWKEMMMEEKILQVEEGKL